MNALTPVPKWLKRELLGYGSEAIRAGRQYLVFTDGCVPVPLSKQMPLAGHAGDCERVCHATVSGKTDAPCSCGATSK